MSNTICFEEVLQVWIKAIPYVMFHIYVFTQPWLCKVYVLYVSIIKSRLRNIIIFIIIIDWLVCLFANNLYSINNSF